MAIVYPVFVLTVRVYVFVCVFACACVRARVACALAYVFARMFCRIRVENNRGNYTGPVISDLLYK